MSSAAKPARASVTQLRPTQQAKEDVVLELPDDDGGDGDDPDPLFKGDRLKILEAASCCYAAACQSDTAPTPPFEHPVALAREMLAFVEGK